MSLKLKHASHACRDSEISSYWPCSLSFRCHNEGLGAVRCSRSSFEISEHLAPEFFPGGSPALARFPCRLTGFTLDPIRLRFKILRNMTGTTQSLPHKSAFSVLSTSAFKIRPNTLMRLAPSASRRLRNSARFATSESAHILSPPSLSLAPHSPPGSFNTTASPSTPKPPRTFPPRKPCFMRSICTRTQRCG
jgi:hypothetical protein